MTSDLDSLPDDVRQLLRKYPSWGAAVKANDHEALRVLLERQRAQEKLNPADLSLALLKAAATLKPVTARVLMDFGAKLGETSNGQDVVQAALMGQNTALVLDFIDDGTIRVDHAEADGTTLLMAALQSEQFDTAEQLFKRGADVNACKLRFSGNGETALHVVARQASFQAVLWLIEKGADPAIEDSEGKQPSEVIPNLDAESAQEWDLDVMFNALEDYKEARAAGRPYEIPLRLREMAFLEATPISAAEAHAKAMEQVDEEKEAQSIEGLLPKRKKAGF